jgi:hypothetical protein
VLADEASTCTRCALAATRTQVVFGTGDPAADLLFVGEGGGAEPMAQMRADLVRARLALRDAGSPLADAVGAR